MNASQYNVAVHGVPLSYYADDPRASEPEQMSDEEWCEANGLTLPDYMKEDAR